MAGTNGPARLPGNARFRWGDGAATEVFTALSKVKSLGIPRVVRTTDDVTNFDSVGQIKEFIGSWGDAGTVAITANWIGDASQDSTTGIMARANASAGAVVNFKIEVLNSGTGITDGFTCTFSGPILEAGISNLTPSGAMELTVQIKVSGKPVFSAAPTT